MADPAAKPCRFRFVSGNPATLEVAAAFFDVGITTLGADDFVALAEAAPDPPPMPAAKVQEMLNVGDDWRLAVAEPGTTTTDVLTRRDFVAALGVPGTEEVVDIALRPIAPSEKLLVDSAAKLYAPDASLDRLKETLALPVAQAGLIATGAGLFGLLALKEDITHPEAMKWAVVVALSAVALSLIGRYSVKAVTVMPGRIDLLSSRLDATIQGPLMRARVGIGLLVLALVLAAIATFPSANSDSPKATLTPPSTTRTANELKGHFSVNWKNLPESVVRVQTKATQGGKELLARSSPRRTDGTTADEFDVSIAPGSVSVFSAALDGKGDTVDSSLKSFAVR